jgi:hypothetical protein
MKQIRSDTDLPWVCMGDLIIEILRREEQLGPHNVTSQKSNK